MEACNKHPEFWHRLPCPHILLFPSYNTLVVHDCHEKICMFSAKYKTSYYTHLIVGALARLLTCWGSHFYTFLKWYIYLAHSLLSYLFKFQYFFLKTYVILSFFKSSNAVFIFSLVRELS